MEAVEHPVAGVDYPSTFQALDEWFRDEVACRAYIRRLPLADRFFLPRLWGCRRAVVEMLVLDAVIEVSLRHARHRSQPPARYSEYWQAAADMVPGDLVRDRGRAVESKAIVASWAAEQRGRGIGSSVFGASRTSPPRACWPSCKKPWSRARQFTPTAGEATPGCRRPATAIRSR